MCQLPTGLTGSMASANLTLGTTTAPAHSLRSMPTTSNVGEPQPTPGSPLLGLTGAATIQMVSMIASYAGLSVTTMKPNTMQLRTPTEPPLFAIAPAVLTDPTVAVTPALEERGHQLTRLTPPPHPTVNAQ